MKNVSNASVYSLRTHLRLSSSESEIKRRYAYFIYVKKSYENWFISESEYFKHVNYKLI